MWVEESSFKDDEPELKERRKRSPQEKKALSYEKDTRIVGEYPHLIRKNLPRKKALANRIYRHKVRSTLANAQTKIVNDEIDALQPETQRRKKIKRWSNPPLKDVVQRRTKRRASFLLGSFFKVPYNSEVHRQRFMELLDSQIVSDKPFAQQLATTLNWLLMPPEIKIGDNRYYWSLKFNEQARTWLKDFLQDAPEQEKQLRQWIARLNGWKIEDEGLQ